MLNCNAIIRVPEAHDTPEFKKFYHDVRVCVSKKYIKNISEWISKMGDKVTDEDGHHVADIVQGCYDNKLSVQDSAINVGVWISVNDWQHTEWDPEPHAPLTRQIMLFDKD